MAEKTVMLVKTESAVNSNKFYELRMLADGSVASRYGRVGDSGNQGKTEYGESGFDRLKREKERKGYRVVDSGVNGTTGVVKTRSFEDVVAKQIGQGNTHVETLVRYLVKANVHDILSGTAITYNASSGRFSTPVGPVSQATIDRARTLLKVHIEPKILGNNFHFVTELNEYMMLIPMNIGRRTFGPETIFPSVGSVEKQYGILDSLEAALEIPEEEKEDEEEKIKSSIRLKMEPVDTKELERIRTKFLQTCQNGHASRSLRPVEAFDISVEAMSSQYIGGEGTNVWELWHGTRTANLLSILTKGLIIPRSAAHGRMFGDGLYFSDQATKSLNYSMGYWSGAREKECFMFLADVNMGNFHVPRGTLSRIPTQYDSCFARAGESGVSNNEMIVYQTSRAKLSRLIKFQE